MPERARGGPTVSVVTLLQRILAAAAGLLPMGLSGCPARPGGGAEHPSISPVPPRPGKPIDQVTVLPDRPKIIHKKPPAP